MALSAEAFSRVLLALLPRGALWLTETSSQLSKLMLGLSDEMARVDQRGDDLIEESDPRTATETLDDWEKMLGLPDTAIVDIPSTYADRRLAITQKLIRQGSQRPAFYVQLAAACGYVATIDDSYGSTVLRAGFLAGAVCRGHDWAHLWKMTLAAPTGGALTHAELEAIIKRAAPSHTVVIFTYS